ncbi:hypothetical protein NKG94_00850 [Micromonospora sp. M12]
MRQSVNQGATLAGFASGGFLSTAFTPVICLLVDGLTFSVSAIVILLFVRRRPAAAAAGEPTTITSTLGLVWRSSARRAIFLMTLSALFLIAPEALAVALAAEVGLSPGGSACSWPRPDCSPWRPWASSPGTPSRRTTHGRSRWHAWRPACHCWPSSRWTTRT